MQLCGKLSSDMHKTPPTTAGAKKLSLILAFLVIFPGFVIGFNFHRNEIGTKAFENFKSAIVRLNAIPGADDRHIEPSIFFRMGLGLSSALVSSLIVLYGIRGSGYLLNRIAGGFGWRHLKKEHHDYWQEVIANEKKIFISLQQQTVDAFGTTGIIRKWGTYYKSRDKIYVVVDRDTHLKTLGKRWNKSIEEIVENGGWQILLDESDRQKQKLEKYLKRKAEPAWISRKRRV